MLTHLKGLCNQLMSFSHFTAEETDAWENELLIVTPNLGQNWESEHRLPDSGLEPIL